MRRKRGGRERAVLIERAVFLIPQFRAALVVAVSVVLVELFAISWIRHRYMDTPPLTAALQVGLGGALVFVTGLLIGSS
jgi:hypothetical protein